MKKNIRALLPTVTTGVTCLVLALALVSSSFAWLASVSEIEDDRLFASSLVNYYHSGAGTINDPYIITEPRHLYNMIWLQNSGSYNTDTVYFQIGDPPGEGAHTVSEIDMAGMLADENGNTGAVPPIGTSRNPFRGHFDGQGCVIKNLWVSTNPDDWAEKPNIDMPANELSPDGDKKFDTDFSAGVGFFGTIDRRNASVDQEVYAGNFVLENIEITTDLSTDNTPDESKVGLVAGYVNGAMSRIGVKNGIMTFVGNDSKNVKSDYVLIGEVIDGTIWQDIPGMGNQGSGDLVIAPSGLNRTGDTNPLYDPFSSVSFSGGKAEVDESIPGSAYYIASAINIKFKPQPSAFYKFNTSISFSGTSVTYSIPKASSTVLSGTTSDTIADGEYLDYCFNSSASSTHTYYRANSDYYGINLGGKPSFSISENTYPTNCIWFKPQNTGTCYIAFANENCSNDKYMSIYRFKRNADGTLQSNSLQEIYCKFAKNEKFTNGTVVLFTLNLTTDDLEYEYAIGRSGATDTLNTTYDYCSFFFLKLAGVDVNGSEAAEAGKTSALDRVEFVRSNITENIIPTAFPDPGYTPIHSWLSMEVLSMSDSRTYRFNRLGDGTVNYYAYPTATPSSHYVTSQACGITEKATSPPDVQSVYSANSSIYPDREKTKPTVP